MLFLFITGYASDDSQKKPTEIRIHNSDTWEGPYPGMKSDGSRLIGNVRLSHEDVYMQCDSAHRYSADNIIHAFGRVHINQGDTLHLYGDHLVYYGNRRYAEVRNNVILKDPETTLTTDHLDFDLENDFGYYPNHGVVINGDNRLESIQGYYFTKEKLFFFKDSVKITNPDYIILSDTLEYNTVTEVVYFMGPTTIRGEDVDIYCENGWYNTLTDISQFNENARVWNNNQLLQADSIFYNNNKGFGEAFTNVEVTDTIENIIIKGNYAWFNREPEQMMITDSALLIQMSDKDTLYMHADTLRSWIQVLIPDAPDTPAADSLLIQPDEHDNDLQTPGNTQLTDNDTVMILADPAPSTEPADTGEAQRQNTAGADTVPYVEPADTKPPIDDSVKNDPVRIMVAYYGVKFFSHEMQGKCDSLYYNMRDSIIFMFGEPVIWSENNQLTAEMMEIHSRDGEVDHIVMTNSSFIASEEAEGLYNQIKGKNITGFVRDGEIYRVNVTGNAETLYFPVEDDEIIGANKAVSASLVIFLKDGRPDRIRFLTQPEGNLTPLEQTTSEERFLKNFIWLEDIRPKKREDVFLRE